MIVAKNKEVDSIKRREDRKTRQVRIKTRSAIVRCYLV
jgi:hypothetical protein